MPHPITIPRLGWSMEEGVFAEWLKAPGEFVRVGDMIFLLEGEKAATEIESLDAGILCVPADAPQPGTTVKVGATIGFLLAEGEPAPTSIGSPEPSTSPAPPPETISRNALASGSPAEPSADSQRPVQILESRVQPSAPRAAGPAARRMARELGIDLNAVFTPDPTGRILVEDVQRTAALRPQRPSVGTSPRQTIATPRAKRRAQELNIDWTKLAGTGRDGRIRERDVEAAVGNGQSAVEKSSEISRLLTANSPLPSSKLRQVLAQRMMAGAHQAAPVTLSTKVNAEALVALRERLKREATDGIVPSYNDLLIHDAAQTLRELPDLNACWHDNGIHSFDAIHIATAVDTSDGLLAPVVRDADRLTRREITEQTRQLIAQARSGQLSQNHLTGGTFTISNLSSFGVDAFTPILNLPQAAILGVGRIVDEPIVRNGEVVAGKTLTLSLTFDHRVLDGAPAARWLQRLCQRLMTER